MDRRLLWHWTSDLFKLNFLVHNPPPCKNQKQKSQTKGSLKREFIVVRSGCRRGAASHWNKKEKLWAALPRPRLGTVWSVDSGDDCDYVPRLAGAGLRVTAQREHRAVPLHTFTGLVTAPGLPSGDTAPLVTSPRIPHFTGELNLSIEPVKHLGKKYLSSNK